MASSPGEIGMTIRVALVSDVPGWAFHNIGKQIEKLSDNQIYFRNFVLQGNSTEKMAAGLAREYDYIHFFWRLAALEANLDSRRITTAIYDHQFENDNKLNNKIFRSVSGIYTSSSRLFEHYSSIAGRYPKVHYANCPDGVNLDFFKPDLAKENNENEFRIMWVGNSKWGQNDHKGLESVFYPAIELVKRSRNLRIVPLVIDSSIQTLSHADIAKEYKKSDLYLCTSRSEGTPNPILEAMASGLPFVSTDVGLVREVAGKIQSQFICQRDPVAFAQKIDILIDNPQIRSSCTAENLNAITKFSWSSRALSLKKFFIDTYQVS